MAHVKRIAIDGKLGINGNRQHAPTFQTHKSKQREEVIEKILQDLEWLERFLTGDLSKDVPTVSRNFVDYIEGLKLGHRKLQHLNVSPEFGTRHCLTHSLLKEKEFKSDNLNKVFCSTWLNDRQILFGTKCNKLIVLDVLSRKIVQIPSLKSSDLSIPPKNPCGIHALQMNPSKTLVATGALNSNDIAIYRLPTLDPLFVGEGAHKDWIFDITWLDDEFLVSGSRDTTIALWRVQDSAKSQKSVVECKDGEAALPKFESMQPLSVKFCKNAEKVRALLFNNNYQELVALSLNAYLHLWDAQTFKQKFSRQLPFSPENVCLAQQLDKSLYAVGSRSHVTLLDSRTLQPASKIPSRYQSCGIRSISFLGELLTIGTGMGIILFYDVRTTKYLEKVKSPIDEVEKSKKRNCSLSESPEAILQATKGPVYADEQYQEFFVTVECNPAIYTHCYDSSGTRLFAAGGPLPASLQGHYAGLFL